VALGVIAAIAVLAVAVGPGVASRYVRSFQSSLEGDIKAGADELLAGKDAARKGNSDHSLVLLKDANGHFEAARNHFLTAKLRLDGNLPLQVAALPVVGSSYVRTRLDTASGIAQMGLSLADAGIAGVAIDSDLLRPDPRVNAGEKLTAVLQQGLGQADRIQTDLETAEKAAGRVDLALLPANQLDAFHQARDTIQTGLDAVREFKRLAPVILEVMGANGPRSYVVEQVDPAELRAGGGFIGSFSILTVDRGKISLGRSDNVSNIDLPYSRPGDPGYVQPPSGLREFTFTQGWTFGDANVIPDFPSSARVAEQLFLNEANQKVDGVMSIDPWAVALFLEVTGPIEVPEFKVTITGKDFPEMVFQQQQAGANQKDPNRKNFFPLAANRMVERITSLAPGRWTDLIKAANTAATQHHLQVYFNNQAAQDEISRFGWANALVRPQPHQESFLWSESNYGGNKVDHFIGRRFDVTLTANGSRLEHQVVVTIRNSTPPGYVNGQRYTCYLRVYLPAEAAGMKAYPVAPPRYLNDEKLDPSLRVFDGWFGGPPPDYRGPGSVTVTFSYTTDFSDLAAGHRIYWQKQPGTVSDAVHVSFRTGGRTYAVDGDLSQDRLLTLTPQGVTLAPASTASAHLPGI